MVCFLDGWFAMMVPMVVVPLLGIKCLRDYLGVVI